LKINSTDLDFKTMALLRSCKVELN
jgi:hypothetical protein